MYSVSASLPNFDQLAIDIRAAEVKGYSYSFAYDVCSGTKHTVTFGKL